MEVAAAEKICSNSNSKSKSKSQQLRVKRKTLQAVLEQCQRALQSIQNNGDEDEEVELDDVDVDVDDDDDEESAQSSDSEADEICDLLKSNFETPNFLEKLGSVHASVSQSILEEGSSWDMVSENDLWDGENTDGMLDPEQEGYVLLKHEDIVEAIACFMAAQLLSLEETKELSPNQLQQDIIEGTAILVAKGHFLVEEDIELHLFLIDKLLEKASFGALLLVTKLSHCQDLPEPSITKSSISGLLEFLQHHIKAFVNRFTYAQITLPQIIVITIICDVYQIVQNVKRRCSSVC